MKLVRYGPKGKEKPGIIDAEGTLRSLAKIVNDIDGESLSPGGLAKIKKVNIAKLPKVAGKPRIGACVGSVGKFVAIGLNFVDHAKESGLPIPKEPIVFNKWTRARDCDRPQGAVREREGCAQVRGRLLHLQ